MPSTTITLPPDVAARLKELARLTGLPPREVGGLLLTLLLGRRQVSTEQSEQS